MSTEHQPNMNEEETKCTCGSCIDGWLSPRMRERLAGTHITHLRGPLFPNNSLAGVAWNLQVTSASLLEDIMRVVPDTELLPEWCIASDVSLQYIPTDLRAQMTPRFWRGNMVVTEAVLRFFVCKMPPPLVDPNATPVLTLAALKEYLEGEQVKTEIFNPPLSVTFQNYLSSGGRLTFALEALLDRAETASSIGAEYRRKPSVRAEEEALAQELAALPACVHDLDFELVRRKMGLPAESLGPCWIFLSDSEGEDDSDEDDDEEFVYTGTDA